MAAPTPSDHSYDKNGAARVPDVLKQLASSSAVWHGTSVALLALALVDAFALRGGTLNSVHLLLVFAAGGFAAAGLAVRGRGHHEVSLRRKHAALSEAETQAENAQDRLWEARELAETWRSIVENHNDIVIHKDMDGRVTYVNTAFTHSFALPLAHVRGHRFQPSILEAADTARGRNGPRELCLDTAHGPRWFLWTELRLRNGSDSTPSIVSVGRDISDHKAAELNLRNARDQAQAASTAKSRFLATVSHEIRTPLNGILGMAALLLDSRLDASQRTYASAVRSSGEALMALIDDILDFSKIEAGKVELNPTPTSLGTLVEQVAELLAPRAHDKGLAIGSFISSTVPARVLVDAARLRQILINLAGNGIKFTETGGVTLEVACTGQRTGASRAQIEFRITDTGRGIASKDAQRIFDEFEQAPATSAGHEGTGLGLAISQRIAKAMGSRLRLESTPGEGAIFLFTLEVPVVEAARAAPTLKPTRPIIVLSPATCEAELLAARLREAGASVTVASNVAALDANTHAQAQFLIDGQLEGGGDAVLTQLRQGGYQPERAIVLLRPQDRMAIEAQREAGFQGYLIRPVRSESLLRMMGDGPSRDFTDDPADSPSFKRLPRAERRRILVAEDNPINALLTRTVLERVGHHVEIVGNGRLAVEAASAARIQGRPHDLVLMDLRMPEMDGMSATRALRREEPAGTHLPVLALTANALPEEREACLENGFDGYLTKPLDPEDLMRAIAGIAVGDARGGRKIPA